MGIRRKDALPDANARWIMIRVGTATLNTSVGRMEPMTSGHRVSTNGRAMNTAGTPTLGRTASSTIDTMPRAMERASMSAHGAGRGLHHEVRFEGLAGAAAGAEGQ